MDSKDRLWIGTNDSGLFLMHRDELRRWDKAEGLKSSSVRAADDAGGGTTENTDNIHKAQDEESKKNGEKKE